MKHFSLIITMIALSGCGMHEEKKNLRGTESGPTSPPSSLPNSSPNVTSEEKGTYSWLKTHLFEIYCIKCHVPGGKAGDYPLNSYDAILSSGVIGPTPETSLLFTDVDSAQMPPRTPRLNDELVLALRKWISLGAQNN